MVDQPRGVLAVEFDGAGVITGAEEGADELARVVREDIAPALETIEKAAQKSGDAVRRALASAAQSGKLSFKDLARSITQDLAGLAIDRFVARPVEGIVDRLFASLPFGGARASGGAVAPGAAFLVGERGPELFAPSVSGRVSPAASSAPPVTVNFHLPRGSDAESFRRSEGQIAAMLARAVGRGARNL